MIENTFITWEMLTEYATFVATVFMLVAFTKEFSIVKKIPTQQYSALVAYVGLLTVNIHEVVISGQEFDYWNLILFALSAIAISMFNGAIADKTGKQ